MLPSDTTDVGGTHISRKTRMLPLLGFQRRGSYTPQLSRKRFVLFGEKQKYLLKFDRIREIGTATVMPIEAAENDPIDELDVVATFPTEFMEEIGTNGEETSDVDTWVCALLGLYNDHLQSNDAHVVDMNIPALSKAIDDLATYATFSMYNNLLLDNDESKSVCSEDWLHKANWNPITKITLPDTTRPLRFSGQKVKTLYIACLFCEVPDIHGKLYIFG